MSTIVHPKQLKGKTFRYNGVVQRAKEVYLLDGQFVLRTDRGKVKINKSEVREKLNDIELVNGSKISGALGTPDEIDPIKVKDEAADRFYCTRKYEQFIFHEKNRMINDAHVNELIRSIKKNNLLFCQPILVNSKYEVIDGQHRLKAAMELDENIYYIIKPGLTIEDAIALNINTKNWGYKDYMEHWIAQGNEKYEYFKEYLERYGLPYSLACGMLMLGKGMTGGGTVTKDFKNGKLELDHQDFAEEIAQLCLDLAEYGDFTTDRSFVLALIEAMDFADLKPDYILDKVDAAPDKFTKCSDSESYIRMMEDVVNYRKRGDRVRLY